MGIENGTILGVENARGRVLPRSGRSPPWRTPPPTRSRGYPPSKTLEETRSEGGHLKMGHRPGAPSVFIAKEVLDLVAKMVR